MLSILVLCFGFCVAILDATIAELMAGPSTMVSQNPFVPLSLNYNIQTKDTPNIPPQIQLPMDNLKSPDCPNNAILISILNILTKLIPKDGQNILEPEKIKYVLNIIKNILENTPPNPNILELYRKFQNLEKQLDIINGRGMNGNLNDKNSPQFGVPTTDIQNCNEIFDNVVKLVDFAYLNIARYCALAENCNQNKDILPNINEGFYAFDPNVNRVQLNVTANVLPIQESLSKLRNSPFYEARMQNDDLVNFVRNQEGKAQNIMTILQNYRPSGDTNIAGRDTNKNMELYGNPQNVYTVKQIPGLSPPVNKPINNIGQNPNPQINNYWQKTIAQEKVPSQNPFENQQYLQVPQNKITGENKLDIPSTYPGMDKVSYFVINGQIVPIKTEVPNQNSNSNMLNYPAYISSINKDPSTLKNLMNMLPKIQQPNVANTDNIDVSRKEPPGVNVTDAVNVAPSLSTVNTPLQNLSPFNTNRSPQIIFQQIPPNLPQNNLKPQQNFNNLISYGPNPNQVPLSYQPFLGANNQLTPNINLGLNQITPKLSIPNQQFKYNPNAINNMYVDNKNLGNYGNQLSDLNRVLGVTNLPKLTAIPYKNGVVELTYMLQRPKPVMESQFYVKYRLPYQTFVYNLQQVLIKKPRLRNDSDQIYKDLLLGSNVTDTSKDLEGLKYEDILNLTSTNGTLVTAKILETNDTSLDETLKLIQKLNSKFPLDNLINYNINASKNAIMEAKNNTTNEITNPSDVNNLPHNIYSPLIDFQRRRVYPNLNYPRVPYNPYSVNQLNHRIHGIPPTKYGYGVPNINTAQVPNYYPQNSFPRVVGYGG